MTEPRDFTITEALKRIECGELTAVNLLKSCFERIRQREETIHAWVCLNEDKAFEEARQLDQQLQQRHEIKPLHGIPVGVKDIIHVQGMITTAGCKAYTPLTPDADAACIAQLRAAGAIIIGKTQTTAFANNDPTITRNPWNPEHTPGGSSSGSGAAVADRMCLAALGSQTGGSLLRPAAYNGIVGLKPTYGHVSLDGVIPVSWTLDHIGPHTRCVEDAALLIKIMKDPRPSPFGHTPSIEDLSNPDFRIPPTLGYINEFFEDEAAPEMKSRMTEVCARLRKAGAKIIDLRLPKSVTGASSAHRIIMETELASYHRENFKARGEDYPPNIRFRIERGLTLIGHTYVDAIHLRRQFQLDMAAKLTQIDAALMISAHSSAPKGLSSTGSHIPQLLWSFSGFPAIAIPSGLDANGMPIGIQLVAGPQAESRLTAVAGWCETIFNFDYCPIDRG
jgi:aspartyl-tRNA(Asn)/glutamyl-tRNA(Gln) amidotransferase subunit A